MSAYGFVKLLAFAAWIGVHSQPQVAVSVVILMLAVAGFGLRLLLASTETHQLSALG
jgi:hypothetical protein